MHQCLESLWMHLQSSNLVYKVEFNKKRLKSLKDKPAKANQDKLKKYLKDKMKKRKLDKNRSDQKSKKGKDKDKEGFKKLLNNMTKISLRTKQSIVSALDRQINWI